MLIERKVQLRDGETLVRVVRPHLVPSLGKYIVGCALLGVSAFFCVWLFSKGWWGQTLFGLGTISGLYICLSTWFFRRANALVLTTDRVLDIHRPSWLKEEINAVPIIDIQDVMIVREGLFPALCNYGTLVMQARDLKWNMEFRRIGAPHRIQALIFENRDARRLHQEVRAVDAVYNRFLQILPTLSEAQLYVVERRVRDEVEKRATPAGAVE